MENARHDPYTGEHSLTEAQVARIMNPEYRPEQQIALLTAMRGQTPVADLSDADFAGLFPASLSVEQMSACAYAVNRCGYNAPLLMMTMQACADMNAQQLMAVGRVFRCHYGKGLHNPYAHPSPYLPADALPARGS